MTVELPRPIAEYFAADAANGAAIANCFTPYAVVVDEKKTYQGRDAIAAWKAASSAKYDYVVQPTDIQVEGEKIVVTAHLTGNFPRGSVDLRYAFTLSGDAIARLEIAP